MIFTKEFFGIAAGVLSAIAAIPYIWSILKGHTRPSGASWWTWSLITVITVASSRTAGATWEVLILPLWLCFSQLVTAVLSLKRGDNRWDEINKVSITGALAGIVLWLVTGQPLIALFASIISDFLASVPNLRHCWRNPSQENTLGWTLGWCSAMLGVFAMSHWSLAESSWAIYFFLNMTITLIFIERPVFSKVLAR